MSTQIAIRLDDGELETLEAEVPAGRASSRSDVVRRGIATIKREQRYRIEEALLVDLGRRGEPVYPDLDVVPVAGHPPLD